MSDMLGTDLAVARRRALDKLQATYTLEHGDILKLAQQVYDFCAAATGIALYEYQKPFALRIIQSMLLEDGEDLSALFSRQSGKTEAIGFVVVGTTIVLPKLAQLPAFENDSRISKFKHGVRVGIFAPTYELAGILHERINTHYRSQRTSEILSDPSIDINLPKGRASLALSNGSFVDTNSAGPGTKIEGKTYHLVIVDECQDVTDDKIKRSIHPMCAATLGTLVKIGTPTTHHCEFLDATDRNRKRTVENHKELPVHFQADYERAAEANPRYAIYVQKEMERLGYDSDEFRMAYRLHWLLERGLWMAPEVFDGAKILRKDTMSIPIKDKTGKRKSKFTRPDYPSTHDRTTPNQIAAIDIGKANSTVVTIARVWWDNPQDARDGKVAFFVHIVNWLEIYGDDHEKQYPQIVDFLKNYAIGSLIVDSTGKGEPVFDRLSVELEEYDIDVHGFVFGDASKHNAYGLLYREVRDKRFTYPAGPGAERLQKYRRFEQQMTSLTKTWRGKYMVLEAPKQKKGKGFIQGKDDYPDSAAMLCWLANRTMDDKADSTDNPFFSKESIANKAKHAKAWFREATRNRREFRKRGR